MENFIVSAQFVCIIGAFIIYMLHVPRFLHIMQLESYHNKDYFNWITKNGKKAFKIGAVQFLFFALLFFAIMLFVKIAKFELTLTYVGIVYLLIALSFFVPNIILLIKDKKSRKNAKKPLKYTARVKRLYFSNFLILMVLRALFMSYLGESFESTLLIYSFLIFTLPLNMLISNFFIVCGLASSNIHFMILNLY